MNLYRDEVLNKRRGIDGDVVIGNPISWSVISWTFFLAVSALLILSCSMTYAEKRVVTGWLVPDGGFIKVTARYGGTIDRLNVTEGMLVSKGQDLALMKLSKNLNTQDSGELIQDANLARLNASQWSGRVAYSGILTQEKEIKQRIELLQRRQDESALNLALAQSANDLALKNLERNEKLSLDGYLAKKAVEDARAAQIQAEQNVSTARSALLGLEQDLTAARGDLANVPIRLANSQAQSSADNASLRADLVQTRANTNYSLVSPIDGRVAAIAVDSGQALNADDVAFVLTEPDTHLDAELYVPTNAVGFIKVGQEVRLRYRAFPFAKFGTGRGRIKSVSSVSLAPTELSIKGNAFTEPVFRVRVALDKNYINAYGLPQQLQSGMLLDAEIIVDRRSLFEWLFEPLYAAGQRL